MCKILTIKQAIVLLLQIKIMYTTSTNMFIIIALEQGRQLYISSEPFFLQKLFCGPHCTEKVFADRSLWKIIVTKNPKCYLNKKFEYFTCL